MIYYFIIGFHMMGLSLYIDTAGKNKGIFLPIYKRVGLDLAWFSVCIFLLSPVWPIVLAHTTYKALR